MASLTKRQMEVLRFIQSFINKNSYSPSIREIGDGLGVVSQNAVTMHLIGLQLKGYISRQDNVSRSIVILKPLEDNADNQQKTSNDCT